MPPEAASIFPMARSVEPVKAPRSRPKSSLSNNASGIAAQLMGTKGPTRRGDSSWQRRAMMSFPVPLSPIRVTVTSFSATFLSDSSSRFIAFEMSTGSKSTTSWRFLAFGILEPR